MCREGEYHMPDGGGIQGGKSHAKTKGGPIEDGYFNDSRESSQESQGYCPSLVQSSLCNLRWNVRRIRWSNGWGRGGEVDPRGVKAKIGNMFSNMRRVRELVTELSLACVFNGFKFLTHGLILTEGDTRLSRVASMAETMEAAAISTMVNTSIDAYFRCSATSICTLYGLCALVRLY